MICTFKVPPASFMLVPPASRASFHTRVWGDVVYYEKEGRGRVDLYLPPILDGTYQIVEGGRLVYEGRSKNGRLVCSYRSYRQETVKGEGNDQDVVRVLRRGGGVDIEERIVPYELNQRFAHVFVVGMILSVNVMVVGILLLWKKEEA